MSKRKKVVKKTLKGKAARAYDLKHMGPEPEFETMPEDPQDRKLLLANSLWWYSYTLKPSEQEEWYHVAEVRGRSPQDIKDMKACRYPELSSRTAMSLCAMSLRGWVLDEREEAKIEKFFDEVIEMGRRDRETRAAQVKKADEPKTKVWNRLFEELDGLEDQWIEDLNPAFDLYQRATACGISKSDVRDYVVPWIEARLDQLNAHRDGDKEIKELMPIKAAVRNKRIKVLEEMKSDAERYCVINKSVRRPKKKVPAKLVKGLKYMKESSEYKCRSLDPTKIIGAKEVWVFETGYRQLRHYVAAGAEGITVSGSSLRNLNEKLSKQKTLRKPQDMLDLIAKTSSSRKIEAEWKKLTTKESQPTSRINDKCVILRVE